MLQFFLSSAPTPPTPSTGVAPFLPIRYQDAFAITPNDSVDLTAIAAGIYVGVAGDVVVDLAGAIPGAPGTTQVTLKAVPVGILQVGVKRVWATGTTAASIVGLV